MLTKEKVLEQIKAGRDDGALDGRDYVWKMPRMVQLLVTLLVSLASGCDGEEAAPRISDEVCTARINQYVAVDVCFVFCEGFVGRCGGTFGATSDVESCRVACEQDAVTQHASWESVYRCMGVAACDERDGCFDRTGVSELEFLNNKIETYCSELGLPVELSP